MRNFCPLWLAYGIIAIGLLALVACGAPVQEPNPAEATGGGAASAQSAQQAQPAAPSAPAPAAATEAMASVEPAVTEQRVARGPTTRDLADPVAGRGDLPVILPLFGRLVQFDQYTDSVFMLSPEWSANEDFSVWTFRLREGSGSTRAGAK